MPHTYECPLRWADLDLLGHINNVSHLDYVAEARERMFGGLPAGRGRVAGHEIHFAAPLRFRRAPVLVDSWVTAIGADDVTLAHEVYDAGERERTVYVRATTRLDHRLDESERTLAESLRGPAPAAREHPRPPRGAAPDGGGSHAAVHVRRSDLDERGHVGDVKFFELLQESRIRYVMDLHPRGESWAHHVIATTDVDFTGPMRRREESYDVHSWVGHLGTRSFTIESEVRDQERVLARATVAMVTFDVETQRPAPMAESQRARLADELAG